MKIVTLPAQPLSPFEVAQLRLLAFQALKGWGSVREDGQWKSWNGSELESQAELKVGWALGLYRCAFCGKPKDEVKRLVAGPAVMICDECIALCGTIMAEKDAEASAVNPSLGE